MDAASIMKRQSVALDMNQLEMGTMKLIEAMRAIGVVHSNADARRLIVQRAVSVDGIEIVAIDAVLEPGQHSIVIGRKCKTLFEVPEK